MYNLVLPIPCPGPGLFGNDHATSWSSKKLLMFLFVFKVDFNQGLDVQNGGSVAK